MRGCSGGERKWGGGGRGEGVGRGDIGARNAYVRAPISVPPDLRHTKMFAR